MVPELIKALEFQKEITGRIEHVIASLKTGDAVSEHLRMRSALQNP